MAKSTLTTRVTDLESEQRVNRHDIDDTQRDIKSLDEKMDGVVLKVATFETNFTNFMNNGLPQRIGDYLAEKGKERNGRWRMIFLAVTVIVAIASLAVAVSVLMRGGAG